MSLIWQIWIALILDFILGDPRWLPHPVRLMGSLALAMERPTRRIFQNDRFAGIVTVVIVVGGNALAAWGLLAGARGISPVLGDAVSIWMLYTAFAARDLGVHGRRVLNALNQGNLGRARIAVSHMVGRDAAAMDDGGVVRAAVESVAENTVDGVLAPLFYAFLLGPVGVLAYKAASTLDSTFGYKNERYLHFGWASARLDDMTNFIPARLSLVFVSIGAVFTGNLPGKAFTIGLRDSRKHASPNAGFPEAAFAGAIGIQLGGPVLRDGVPVEAPLLGDTGEPLGRYHIAKAIRLMAAATMACALLLSFVRALWERI